MALRRVLANVLALLAVFGGLAALFFLSVVLPSGTVVAGLLVLGLAVLAAVYYRGRDGAEGSRPGDVRFRF